MAMQGRSSMPVIPYIDTLAAQEKARLGALDEAVELARSAVDEALEGGSIMWSPVATRVLVETLLKRGGETDLWEAKTVIDKLAAIPTDPRLRADKDLAATATGAAGAGARRRCGVSRPSRSLPKNGQRT